MMKDVFTSSIKIDLTFNISAGPPPKIAQNFFLFSPSIYSRSAWSAFLWAVGENRGCSFWEDRTGTEMLLKRRKQESGCDEIRSRFFMFFSALLFLNSFLLASLIPPIFLWV